MHMHMGIDTGPVGNMLSGYCSWHRGLEFSGSIRARRIGVSQIANKPTARPQAAIGHEYCVGYAGWH